MSLNITSKLILILCISILVEFESSVYGKGQSDIDLRINIENPYHKIGESITVICEFRNTSNSTIWLPPLQIVQIHFSLYEKDEQVIHFDIPSMTMYGPDAQECIELLPGHSRIFKRVLTIDMYKLPVFAGSYRLCALYANDKASIRDINLWVGKIQSCALLKIQ